MNNNNNNNRYGQQVLNYLLFSPLQRKFVVPWSRIVVLKFGYILESLGKL